MARFAALSLRSAHQHRITRPYPNFRPNVTDGRAAVCPYPNPEVTLTPRSVFLPVVDVRPVSASGFHAGRRISVSHGPVQRSRRRRTVAERRFSPVTWIRVCSTASALLTAVTSVTGVTGWADTFAVTVVAHENRSNPSPAIHFISPGISSGGWVVGALHFDSGTVAFPRPPAKESVRPEREWLRRPFRRRVPSGTARQEELLALAPCGGVGCGRTSGRPRRPVGALAQGIY